MASQLRQKLIHEIELRDLEKTTLRDYVKAIEKLAIFYNKSPDKIGIPEIKDYQHYLLVERKLKPNTVNRELCAIRFFYKHVLLRHWYRDALPKVKAPKTIPVVLSEEEVASMINNTNSVFYKAVLMLLYSSGLRQAELRNLKVSDIDNKRGIITIRNGKCRKDRQALLSPLTLMALKTYWVLFRSKNPTKSEYLFIPTKNSYSGKLNKNLSHTALGYIVRVAKEAGGIKKKSLLIRLDIPLQFTF